MNNSAAKKTEQFSSIWDIPNLDLQELKQLIQAVPVDTLRLALLNVSDEIRNCVYHGVTPTVAEQLKAFIQLKKMMLEKGVLKEADIQEAQDEVGQALAKLFRK